MIEEDVRQKLVAHCYTPEGKSRGARLTEPYLRKNGLNSEVDFVISACSGILPDDYLFSRKLAIFCKNKVFVPHCKTCGIEYFQWSTKKNDWSNFCSQKCTQNDPEVKARNQYGQRDVDWGKTIDKRKITMQEKYGVESWSQLDEAKQDFVIRTKEAWADETRKEERLTKRKETNIEKYGVEHTSQNEDIAKRMSNTMTTTLSLKTDEQKQENIDKYRKTRLGEELYEKITNYDFMSDLYVTKELSVVAISKQLSCSVGAVMTSLLYNNIQYDASRDSTSMLEYDVGQFIKSINSDVICKYRDKIEIDVYVPLMKLGFETNGNYWHSTLKVSKSYHKEKVEYFHNKGIRIVQIWEDDWNNKPEVVKKFIRNILNDNKERIGARKTKVVNLSQSEFDFFMNENHMQGRTRASVRLGLEYEGKIVSVMGFKNIPVNVNPVAEGIGYELNRFANTNVTGAFTKLLSYFEKNHQVDFITSFGDMEIVSMDSNVYTKNGFFEIYRIREDYRYYDYRTDKREHKFNFRKSRFAAMGYDVENKTETELAKEHKLLLNYDSGKIQYLKIVK